MSEGPLFFICTGDFRSVDRRRSETKELMSKKITQHVRYKTCIFPSGRTQEKNVK